MTKLNEETLYYLEMLPEQDQKLAQELIKKMVVAWDPDFTKLTPEEEKEMLEAEEEIARGEYYTWEEALEMLGIDKNEVEKIE